MNEEAVVGAEAHRAKYVRTWAMLLALLVVSIAVGYIGNVVVATVLVFGVSAVKAYLVVANFMHLIDEPRWLKVFMVSGVLAIAVLIFALLPDIVYVYGG